MPDDVAYLDSLKTFYWPAVVTWFVEWLCLFGFSRYAAWRSNRDRDMRWGRWALVYVYEQVIFAKKFALVVNFFTMTTAFHNGTMCKQHPIGDVFFEYLTLCAYMIYMFTYVPVFYILLSHSAGTTDFKRGFLIMIVISVVVTLLALPENLAILNQAFDCSLPSWGLTVLSESLPWQTLFMWTKHQAWIDAWLFVISAIVLIALCVVLQSNMWKPRQPALAVFLLASFSAFQLATCFVVPVANHWHGYQLCFFLGVAEAPIKYYIMVQDSRYWTNLSIDADVGYESLSKLNDPLLGGVARELLRHRNEISQDNFKRAPHIHFSRIVMDSVIGSGGEGQVYPPTYTAQTCWNFATALYAATHIDR